MSESLSERQDAVDRDLAGPSRRTPAGDALSRLVVELFRVNGRLAAAGDALARPVGQTSARWQVLAAIEDDPAAVASVARLLGLTRQSVQRVADLLVAEGLATFEPNPGHRRAKLLRLTAQGRTALSAIQVAQRGWADAIGARIGEPDLRRAADILERLRMALDGSPSSR